MMGAMLFIGWYMFLCHRRWLIARHYGEEWRLMGLKDMMQAWDHLSFSSHATLFRIIVIMGFAIAIMLMVLGISC